MVCLIGVTRCRSVSYASLPAAVNGFFFVVGLLIVSRIVKISAITATLFSSYTVVLALCPILRRKTGARRLHLWGMVAKVHSKHDREGERGKRRGKERERHGPTLLSLHFLRKSINPGQTPVLSQSL